MEDNDPILEQVRTKDLPPQPCWCQLNGADSVMQIPEKESFLSPSRTSDGFP